MPFFVSFVRFALFVSSALFVSFVSFFFDASPSSGYGGSHASDGETRAQARLA
ncbi:hypothetical protein [Streptomyces sp. NPDC000994]